MSKYDVRNLRVVLGDHDLTKDNDADALTYRVKRVIRHKGFDTSTLHNDIAILTLEKVVAPRANVKPICLDVKTSEFAGRTVRVAGWGTLRDGGSTSPRLRHVDVRVWKNSECATSYGTRAPGGIIDSMICASKPEQKKDSCSVRSYHDFCPSFFRAKYQC